MRPDEGRGPEVDRDTVEYLCKSKQKSVYILCTLGGVIGNWASARMKVVSKNANQ